MLLRPWLDGWFSRRPLRRQKSLESRISLRQSSESLEVRALLSAVTYALMPVADNPFAGLSVGELPNWDAPSPAPGSASTPTLADLDNDGDLDLLSGAPDGTLRYFKNVGTLTQPDFTARTGTANPFSAFDVGLQSAPTFVDLDSDGDFDVISGDQNGGFSYFKNTGTPNNPAFTRLTGAANPLSGFSVGTFNSLPTFADLDDDGDLDLICGLGQNPTGKLIKGDQFFYFENMGSQSNPVFTLISGTASPFSGIFARDLQYDTWASPAFMDIDHDGDLDLVAGTSSAFLYTHLNIGSADTPQFASATNDIDSPFYNQSDARPVDFYTFMPGYHPVLAFGDLDADGDIDLVCGSVWGTFGCFKDLTADLQLSQTASRTTTKAGDQITFTVTITNNGPDTAYYSTIKNIPAGLTNVTVTPSIGTYELGTGDWNIPALPATPGFNTTTLKITGTVGDAPAGSSVSNNAEVIDSRRDPDSIPNNHLATEDDQTTLSVSVLNSAAPVLHSAALDLGTVPAGTAANTGFLIRELIQSAPVDLITDTDIRPSEGIAVFSTLSTQGTWQFSLNDGKTWANMGTVSTVSARVLAADDVTRLRFIPNLGASGQDGFSFYAWDRSKYVNTGLINTTTRGGITPFSTASLPVTITITAANTAPFLNNAGTPSLKTYYMNDTANPGTPITDLIASMAPAGGIFDTAGVYTRCGIAITGADTSRGAWQYTLDKGLTWLPLANVSEFSARLLAADSKTRIRFVPLQNYKGTLPNALTFRAWDQTAGSNGAVGNAVSIGTTSEFSSSTETASITVRPYASYMPMTGADSPIADLVFGLNAPVNYPRFVDFDLDGDQDLVLIGVDLRYFKNTGTATNPVFVEQTGTANPLNTLTTHNATMTFVDFDGDNDWDVVAGDYHGYFQYFQNTGTNANPNFVQRTYYDNPLVKLNTFIPKARLSSLMDDNSPFPTFVDLDADGDLDLVAGTNNGYFHYFKNVGGRNNPIFVDQISENDPFTQANATRPFERDQRYNYDTKPQFVDFDSDGDFDLIAGNDYTAYWYYKNIGTPTNPRFILDDQSQYPITAGFRTNSGPTPSIADLDADGDFDVVNYVMRIENGSITGRYDQYYKAVTSDLQLSQNSSATSRLPGDPVTITLAVTNKGTDLTSNVKISDIIPAGLTNVTITPSRGGYTNGVWSMTTLPAGFTASLKITGTIGSLPIGSTLTNTAEVIASDVVDVDSNPNNHVADEDDQSSLGILIQDSAPVLNPAGDPRLPTIDQDQPIATNTGMLVSDLIAAMTPGGITDPNTVAIPGIAIIGANQTSGIWQFMTNGTDWKNFGTVTTERALTLAPDLTTRVRFLPANHYTGTVGFTFVAWDQFLGSNGSFMTVTGTGGSFPFSTGRENAFITVTPLNDAPVLDPSGNPTLTSIPEDVSSANNPGTLISTLLAGMAPGGITDIDLGAKQGIALDSVNINGGAWQYSLNNGTTWSPVGTVSQTSALLLAADDNTRLRFLPTLNFNGSNTIAFSAWDQSTGTNGTKVNVTQRGARTAFSTERETATINVTPVNDAPVLNASGNPALPSLPWNVPSSINQGMLVTDLIASMTPGGITEIDAGDKQGIAIDSLVGAGGTWQFSLDNGQSWTNMAPVSLSSSLLLAADNNTRIRFSPALNFLGEGKFYFSAWDQSAGTNGTRAETSSRAGITPFSGLREIATVAVALNNAPVLNAATLAYSGPVNPITSAQGLRIADLVSNAGGIDLITDVDANPFEGIAIYNSTQSVGTWQFSTDNGATWTNLGSVSNSSSRLLSVNPRNRIRLVPNPSGTGTDIFRFYAWDQTNGLDGAVASTASVGGNTAFSTNNLPVTINVNANRAPVLDPSGDPRLPSIFDDITSTSNTGLLITDLIARMGGTRITDPNNGALQGIAVNSIAPDSHGTWQYSLDNAATWTNLGAVSDSSSLLLAANASTRIRFVPDSSYHANYTVSFTFRAWDQTSGLNGALVDTSLNGGTSSFSTAVETASITVKPS